MSSRHARKSSRGRSGHHEPSSAQGVPVAGGKLQHIIQGQKFWLFPRYEPKKMLGKGSYGVVVTAFDNEMGKNVAVKKIRPMARDEWDAKHTLREIRLMRLLGDHPNIISLYSLDIEESREELYLVMELMECDLHKIIQSKQQLSHKHFKCLIKQLLDGVKAMHDRGVLHRDLKPGNILVTSDCQLRITDFGLARFIDNLDFNQTEAPFMTEYVVTRWYRCPELLLAPQQPYNAAVDMWSVGCIFGEMLKRRALFPGNSYSNQVLCIMEIMGPMTEENLGYRIPDDAKTFLTKHNSRARYVPLSQVVPDATEDALGLMEQLLELNPATRITAEEALQTTYVRNAYDIVGKARGNEPPPEREDPREISFDFDLEEMSLETLRELIRGEVGRFRRLNSSSSHESSSSSASASAAVAPAESQTQTVDSTTATAPAEGEATSTTDASSTATAVAASAGGAQKRNIVIPRVGTKELEARKQQHNEPDEESDDPGDTARVVAAPHPTAAVAEYRSSKTATSGTGAVRGGSGTDAGTAVSSSAATNTEELAVAGRPAKRMTRERNETPKGISQADPASARTAGSTGSAPSTGKGPAAGTGAATGAAGANGTSGGGQDGTVPVPYNAMSEYAEQPVGGKRFSAGPVDLAADIRALQQRRSSSLRVLNRYNSVEDPTQTREQQEDLQRRDATGHQKRHSMLDFMRRKSVSSKNLQSQTMTLGSPTPNASATGATGPEQMRGSHRRQQSVPNNLGSTTQANPASTTRNRREALVHLPKISRRGSSNQRSPQMPSSDRRDFPFPDA